MSARLKDLGLSSAQSNLFTIPQTTMAHLEKSQKMFQ
jgi:hypothetical protein